ncbi:MAG: Cof-type HAD-IIB family hydrolase [Eisenbergiella sp.]
MSKKILFTDLDGTLLTGDKKISPSMQLLLSRLVRSGNRLVLTSGRALPSILQVAQKASLLVPDTVIIAANGNEIYDCDSQSFLLRKNVPTDAAQDIIDIARSFGIYIQSYDDRGIVSPKEGAELSRYAARTGMSYVISDDILKTVGHPPCKLLAIALDGHAKLEQFRDAVLARHSDIVSAIFSNPEYLEIFDKTAGKGNAVRFVCDHFGIPLSESVAAGDAENDISMLEASGCAVAMANADPAVKACADYITQKDNDHDGLSEAIIKYFDL